MRRVVVTGMGLVSPLGNSVSECWENLVAGKNGIGPITLFDTENYKAKLAAEVKDFDAREYMPKAEMLKTDRYAQFGFAAACQAMEYTFSPSGCTESRAWRSTPSRSLMALIWP